MAKKKEKEDTKGKTPQEKGIPERESLKQTSDIDQEIDKLPVVIHRQYIKDLSFENPNAPYSMAAGEGKPQIKKA